MVFTTLASLNDEVAVCKLSWLLLSANTPINAWIWSCFGGLSPDRIISFIVPLHYGVNWGSSGFFLWWGWRRSDISLIKFWPILWFELRLSCHTHRMLCKETSQILYIVGWSVFLPLCNSIVGVWGIRDHGAIISFAWIARRLQTMEQLWDVILKLVLRHNWLILLPWNVLQCHLDLVILDRLYLPIFFSVPFCFSKEVFEAVLDQVFSFANSLN